VNKQRLSVILSLGVSILLTIIGMISIGIGGIGDIQIASAVIAIIVGVGNSIVVISVEAERMKLNA
jgi:hypothetical protein